MHLGEMLVDEVLIAAQLGSRIATDGLHTIRGAGIVEGVGSKIEDAEVGILVAVEDLLLPGLHLERLLERIALREHAVVHVALIHGPHINEDEGTENGGKDSSATELAALDIEINHSSSHQHKAKRTEDIGLEHRRTFGNDAIGQPVGKLREHTLVVRAHESGSGDKSDEDQRNDHASCNEHIA